MGRMGEIALDRDMAVQALSRELAEARQTYFDLLDRYPISDRTAAQINEIGRAEGICLGLKMQLHRAQDWRVYV